MNVIGEKIRVLSATDPTLAGLTGLAVLETLNTLTLRSGGRNVRLAKRGAALQFVRSGIVLTGTDLAGRLQDRVGRKPR